MNLEQALQVSDTALNSIGLAMDIAGVILLYFFGLSKNITREGAQYIYWGGDEEEQQQWIRYRFLSRVGLILLVIGFSLQIVSNFL